MGKRLTKEEYFELRTEEFEHTFTIRIMERWHHIPKNVSVLIKSVIQQIFEDDKLKNIVQDYVQNEWSKIVKNREKFMWKDGEFVFKDGETPEYFEV